MVKKKTHKKINTLPQNTSQKTKVRAMWIPLKTVMILWIYGRLSHSWSTCGTRDATHVSQERGNKYEIVTTANGIYLWWQIFVSGKQFMMAMVKVMISTLPPETRSFSSFLVSIIISQRNSDRKHKFWNIVSTAERCILHMYVLLECRFICIRKFTME